MDEVAWVEVLLVLVRATCSAARRVPLLPSFVCEVSVKQQFHFVVSALTLACKELQRRRRKHARLLSQCRRESALPANGPIPACVDTDEQTGVR